MSRAYLQGAVLCAALAAAYPAGARVTEINTVAVEPFAEGASYGTTGAYDGPSGVPGEADPPGDGNGFDDPGPGPPDGEPPDRKVAEPALP